MKLPTPKLEILMFQFCIIDVIRFLVMTACQSDLSNGAFDMSLVAITWHIFSKLNIYGQHKH